MKTKHIIILILSSLIISCATINPNTGQAQLSRTTIGTGVGASAGAVLGQIIGRDTRGTIIGAVAGSAIGAIVGDSFDEQEMRLRNELANSGVEIKRSNENEITLIASENITFNTNSSTILPRFTTILDSVTTILLEYQNSNIVISGHVDNTESDTINNPLSLNRANTVANYFIQHGISSNRVSAIGYGNSQPIASNLSIEGRTQNRRVEIKIIKN